MVMNRSENGSLIEIALYIVTVEVFNLTTLDVEVTP
jgi:hypothetical protein